MSNKPRFPPSLSQVGSSSSDPIEIELGSFSMVRTDDGFVIISFTPKPIGPGLPSVRAHLKLPLQDAAEFARAIDDAAGTTPISKTLN